MTLQQFEYILAVNEFRHFGKAAEHCHVTQPTLSAMIQKLEEELGVKLFDRSVQPVCPTLIGQKIIAQAQTILQLSHQITEFVAEEQDSVSGSLRLGILPTIAPYLLPRFYPQFCQSYPSLDIQVLEMKIDQIEKALLQGELDAALIATAPESKKLRVDTLFYEEFFGYIATSEALFKQDMIRSSDISGQNLWLLDEGHCFRDQLVKFCNLKGVQASRQAYRLGSMETFMRMVESGQGITLIPELALDQLNSCQQELVRPFAIPRPARQIRLLTHLDFIRQSLLSKLKEAILAAIPESMHTLKQTQYLV